MVTNSFDLSEDVYCYAGNLPASTPVDIYVVNNKDDWEEGNTYKVNVGFEAIPEFATIAIPVAAIIGLLFLFSQRRKKEE